MKREFLIPALCVIALAGCDFSETTGPAPVTPPPAPVVHSVTAAGECNALAGAIQCRDSSSCFADNEPVVCQGVLWSARNTTTGIDAGSLTGEHNSDVQFTGLAAGTYLVTQTTTGANGIATDTETHNPTVS